MADQSLPVSFNPHRNDYALANRPGYFQPKRFPDTREAIGEKRELVYPFQGRNPLPLPPYPVKAYQRQLEIAERDAKSSLVNLFV